MLATDTDERCQPPFILLPTLLFFFSIKSLLPLLGSTLRDKFDIISSVRCYADRFKQNKIQSILLILQSRLTPKQLGSLKLVYLWG